MSFSRVRFPAACTVLYAAVLFPAMLSAQPRMWMSAASTRADFWEMFQPGSGWDTLRSRIDVFSIHVNALTARTDTALIRRAAQSLDAAGVKVNFECGGLRPFSGCDSLAGEHHAALELSELAMWTAHGGHIDFITMDSPINTMIAGGDPSGNCGWTVERAAGEMADYMTAVRRVFPSVTFCLVEPVPWYHLGPYPAHPGNDYGDLIATIDTVLAVLAQRGEHLEIFHSDSPWEYSSNTQVQGWNKLVYLEKALHARGLRHGRISNSQDGGFTSDSLYSARTLDSYTAYRAAGGNPDEIEVWCWYQHPAVNTPEWQPFTFAYTCRRFIDLAASAPARAKFEPDDGRVYHGVGQSGQGIAEYEAALSDSSIMPLVIKYYYSIPGSRGNKFAELRSQLSAARDEGRMVELSLAFTDERVATDSVIAVSAVHDAIIDSLAAICRSLGARMFVRPGFEFNGPWNGYHPYLLPQAFRKVVDRFRAAGASDSVAFIWCYYPTGAANDFDSTDARGARWYPGDGYTDWFGLDLFQSADFDPALPSYIRGVITSKGKSERFLSMARAHGKPVMLSEVSAAGVTITADSADGIADWNAWFEPYFSFIASHPEVKGFNYIDWDWRKYPQWASWGDARLENNSQILARYRAEMRTPRYIHRPYSITAHFDTVQVAYIAVDTSAHFQTMDGWGASSNFYEERIARLPAAVRSQLFDLVFKDLGANILCIRLYSDFQATQGGAYNWNTMTSQRMIAGEALARGLVDRIWVKVSSPPGWMKDNGSATGGGHVLPSMYQAYADYLSAYIRGMKNTYGIRISAVSLFNEPGFAASYESTTTTPEEYRDILAVVWSTFVRDGIGDVELMGPETGKVTESLPYADEILADPQARLSLARFTVHQYGDQKLLYGTGPADNWPALRDRAAAAGKKLWETEMFIGGPGMHSNDMAEGLRVMLLIHTALTQGNISAWHYWQYAHPEEASQDGSSGIIQINTDGTLGVFPRYACMMQWMKHVHAGAVRVASSSTHPAVHSTAFTGNGELVLVLDNTSDSAVSAVVNFPPTAGAPRHYRTSASEMHAIAPEPLPGNVVFYLTLVPRSASTVVVPLTTTDVASAPLARPASIVAVPNPASHTAEIVLRGFTCGAELRVFDMLGRSVMHAAHEAAGERRITLDVSSLPPGVYMLAARDEHATARTLLRVVR